MVHEKIYLEVEINNQYICLRNNIELLYFILGRAELRWNLSSIPYDGSDIYRYSNKKWVLTISSILFLRQMYWFFIYLFFQIFFLIDHHCKTKSELTGAIENSQKWMLFWQCANVLTKINAISCLVEEKNMGGTLECLSVFLPSLNEKYGMEVTRYTEYDCRLQKEVIQKWLMSSKS